MRWLAAGLLLAGCASAGPGNVIIGGVSDAGTRGDPGDAGMGFVLTQNASLAITPSNSFNCGIDQTSYYRVFTLANYGVTSTLHITRIDLGVESAAAAAGAAQPATLSLGSYTGTAGGDTLDLTQVVPIGSVDFQIPDGSDLLQAVPLAFDALPSAQLIVELAIPATAPGGNEFFIGTSTADEGAPGYLRSDGCALTAPTSMQSVAGVRGLGKVHLVLTVTGNQ